MSGGTVDVAMVADAVARLARPTLVAVDGVDGSGKTTFAERLLGELTARGRTALVVHLDDFLNPRAVRYRLGRHSPEGFFADTYDLAAFTAGVVEPLRPGGRRAILLRTFDHRTDRRLDEEPVTVPADAVVVVEGMFLHREELVDEWDVSVFLDVPFTVTAPRLALRDGSNPDPEHPSMSRYVEGQRRYLSACRPADRATFVVENW